MTFSPNIFCNAFIWHSCEGGSAMGQSVLVTSGKGGTGKTSLTAGIATCLGALGKRVVCVDADVGLRNLDIALGMSERSAFDFMDVINDPNRIGDALMSHAGIPNLRLLPAPTGLTPSDIPRGAFRALIRRLADASDYVFVDGPAGLSDGFDLAAGACGSAIVVASPDPLAIRDASRASQMLTEHDPVWLVLNRVRPKLVRLRYAINMDDAMDDIGLPLLGIVPEDEIVMAAASKGVPVILAASTGAAVSYLNIAKRFLGMRVPLERIKVWKIGS